MSGEGRRKWRTTTGILAIWGIAYICNTCVEYLAIHKFHKYNKVYIIQFNSIKVLKHYITYIVYICRTTCIIQVYILLVTLDNSNIILCNKSGCEPWEIEEAILHWWACCHHSCWCQNPWVYPFSHPGASQWLVHYELQMWLHVIHKVQTRIVVSRGMKHLKHCESYLWCRWLPL